MKVARIAVLAIAIVAGFIAWSMARNAGSDDGEPVIVERTVETDQVLVAARDLQPGMRLAEADLAWQEWPRGNVNAGFIVRSETPEAPAEVAGSVARGSFVEGEPIRHGKLVRAEDGGYLSAVLPAGMRAVATATSPQTGAGGFILPNDRVDVILIRRDDGSEGPGNGYSSETILRNIRVLAIDQTVEDQDGRNVVVGNVATLALRPEQAEVLTMAQQAGDISLALRSIMDGDELAEAAPRQSDSVNVVKFGVRSRARTN